MDGPGGEARSPERAKRGAESRDGEISIWRAREERGERSFVLRVESVYKPCMCTYCAD